jgi:hypothetical protein
MFLTVKSQNQPKHPNPPISVRAKEKVAILFSVTRVHYPVKNSVLELYLTEGSVSYSDLFVTIINTRQKQFEDGKVYLAHGCRGFGPWLVSSVAFRCMTKQDHHGERACCRKTAQFVAGRKQR